MSAGPDALRSEARSWFALASDDIAAVGLCLRSPRLLRGIAAYHCQQAAEKLMKGLIAASGAPVRKTHDLAVLAREAGAAYPELARSIAAASDITLWGVAFRYSGVMAPGAPRPSRRQIAAALKKIDTLRRSAIAAV
jgi:HEPN domain-containing protein